MVIRYRNQVTLGDPSKNVKKDVTPLKRDPTINYDDHVNRDPIDYTQVDANRLPSDFNDKVA